MKIVVVSKNGYCYSLLYMHVNIVPRYPIRTYSHTDDIYVCMHSLRSRRCPGELYWPCHSDWWISLYCKYL